MVKLVGSSIEVVFLHTLEVEEVSSFNLALWASKPDLIAGKLPTIASQKITEQWHKALAPTSSSASTG